MKSSVYGRSKNKWKSEQEALLDVLEKQNLTSEQLIAEHDENQYRWRLIQETDSTLGGIVGCLFVIGLIVVGVVFGVDFYDKNFNKNDSVNENPVIVDTVNVDNSSSQSEVEDFQSQASGYDSINDDNSTSSSTSSSTSNSNNNRLIICTNCNGSKLVDVRCCVNLSQKCNQCDDYGWKRAECPVCNGRGRVKEYE